MSVYLCICVSVCLSLSVCVCNGFVSYLGKVGREEKPEHLAARQQDVDEDKKVHKGVENEEDDITVPVCLEVRSYW